jgi:uncharacterized membrane protein
MKIKVKKDVVFFVFSTLMILAIILFGINSTLWRNDDLATDDISFFPGRVTEVVDDRTSLNAAGARVGSQDLLIELLSGPRSGDVIAAQNLLFPIEHGIYAQVGQRVLVFFQQGADGVAENYFSHIQSYDRTRGIYFIVLAFLTLLIAIFGKSGIRAAFGLIFTFVSIIFLLLPLIAYGFSPALLTISISFLIVVVSTIAIMGFQKKTYVSIIGGCIGILCYCLFYLLTGFILRIDGFNIAEIDLLIVAGFYIGVRELLFASILIASLGGILDVAVSLSSAMFELSRADENKQFKVLFHSGLKVSKDMIGTSSNTLILAFTGTFLISLILFAITNTQYDVMINRVDISIEILRAVSASAAMIVCAPITVLISAIAFSRQIGFKKYDKEIDLNEKI